MLWEGFDNLWAGISPSVRLKASENSSTDLTSRKLKVNQFCIIYPDRFGTSLLSHSCLSLESYRIFPQIRVTANRICLRPSIQLPVGPWAHGVCSPLLPEPNGHCVSANKIIPCQMSGKSMAPGRNDGGCRQRLDWSVPVWIQVRHWLTGLQQGAPSRQSRCSRTLELPSSKQASVHAMGAWRPFVTSVFCLLQSWGIWVGLGISKGKSSIHIENLKFLIKSSLFIHLPKKKYTF